MFRDIEQNSAPMLSRLQKDCLMLDHVEMIQMVTVSQRQWW